VTKPNPENCKNSSSKCAYDCAQLQYTIQHRTVLIIFPSYRQTNIIAQKKAGRREMKRGRERGGRDEQMKGD